MKIFFKKVLSDRIKNNTYSIRKEDFSNLESRFHQDLKNRSNSNNALTIRPVIGISEASGKIILDDTLGKNIINEFKNRIKNMSEEELGEFESFFAKITNKELLDAIEYRKKTFKK